MSVCSNSGIFILNGPLLSSVANKLQQPTLKIEVKTSDEAC